MIFFLFIIYTFLKFLEILEWEILAVMDILQ